MIERTLIFSDLHLGNGGDFDIYAGGSELAALLDREAAKQPTRVILNGDTIDFLLNTDPLTLSIPRAVSQARASVAHADTAGTLRALGRVLAAGGEVIIRLGNHDAELALGEVQAVIRDALGQPKAVADRLRFERGETPRDGAGILKVGGARVLVTHGEQNDDWNRLPYDSLPGPDGPEVAADKFVYPAGSRLVKTLLNPLKKEYGMRFADLLKPDFQGGVLTALAVDASAVKTVFKGSTLTMLYQLFRQSLQGVSFVEGKDEGESDLGLAERLDEAGLTESERAALAAALGDEAGASFAEGDGVLDAALVKLGRAGLSLYARTQRSLVGESGDRYFATAPDDGEWKEAQRLAAKFHVGAVIIGHTHAARFGQQQGTTFVNTGTWIWLMQPPAASASNQEWEHFLLTCRKNPQLDPKRGESVPVRRRLTYALVEPAAGSGARVALLEWQPEHAQTVVLGESHVPAAASAGSRS